MVDVVFACKCMKKTCYSAQIMCSIAHTFHLYNTYLCRGKDDFLQEIEYNQEYEERENIDYR